jgi:hypothetical protein
MFNKEDVANIILHVTFISVFIGIFFFTYGSYIEKKIVKKQVEFLIKSNKNMLIILPPEIKKTLLDEINMVKLDFVEEDKKVEEQNKKLKKKAFILFIICLVIGLSIVWKMSNSYNFGFSHLIKENLIILLFVAIVEFSYFTFIAQYYLSIDPNIIKRRLFTSVNNIKSNK